MSLAAQRRLLQLGRRWLTGSNGAWQLLLKNTCSSASSGSRITGARHDDACQWPEHNPALQEDVNLHPLSAPWEVRMAQKLDGLYIEGAYPQHVHPSLGNDRANAVLASILSTAAEMQRPDLAAEAMGWGHRGALQGECIEELLVVGPPPSAAAASAAEGATAGTAAAHAAAHPPGADAAAQCDVVHVAVQDTLPHVAVGTASEEDAVEVVGFTTEALFRQGISNPFQHALGVPVFAEDEEEGVHSGSPIVWAESVRRKRMRKMNKHKHRKRLKKLRKQNK